MKKLLTLLFAAALTFSMTGFAQTSGGDMSKDKDKKEMKQEKKEMKKEKKEAKKTAKKEKKAAKKAEKEEMKKDDMKK